MLGINMSIPPFGLMLWKRRRRFARGLQPTALVLPGGLGEPVGAMLSSGRGDPPRDRLSQASGGAIDGDERVGVGVPYRHDAQTSQPHVDLARDARRTVVAVQSGESDTDPPSADVIGGRPYARLGITP